MKILYVINNLGSGGAEKLLETSLPIMNKIDNIEVELLLLGNKNNVYYQEMLDNNIKVNISKVKGMRNPLNIWYIKKIIRRGSFDIVHVNLFPSIYWVSFVAKLDIKRKIKYYVTEHNTHNKRRKIKVFKYIEKTVYKSFDKIYSISDATQKNLLDWLEPNEKQMKKFEIIENGIDLNKFNTSYPIKMGNLIPNLNDTDKLISMTGSFTPQKDQLTVIESLKYLPSNIKIIFIGEGPLKEDYIQKVKELNLSKQVYFLGFQKDVHSILKASDIVVLSSHWEGFGLAAVEGMACGKPVVASNVPGLASIIDDSELIFEEGNSKELAKVINKLLDDLDFLHEKTISSYNKAKKYDINKMIHHYLKSYDFE